MNPADLYRSDSAAKWDENPVLGSASKSSSSNGTGGVSKNGKFTNATSRIDTEQIYGQLKLAIGIYWEDYRAALGSYLIGKANHVELNRILDPIFVLAASNAVPTTAVSASQPSSNPIPATHLHNQLLAAIYANALFRETPPETTASWVLATDIAPSSSLLNPTAKLQSHHHAGSTNDKIEERNKREVMSLSARDRRRIKSVKDSSDSMASGGLGIQDARMYQSALEPLVFNPSMTDMANTVNNSTNTAATLINSTPTGLTTSGPTVGIAKTNIDLEVRRRFNLPLATETSEFPAQENIIARIEPICYEQGLSSGGVSNTYLSNSIGNTGGDSTISNGTGSGMGVCAELVETAVQIYVKEWVTKLFKGCRVDGTNCGANEGILVCTERYRKRLRREEETIERRADRPTQESSSTPTILSTKPTNGVEITTLLSSEPKSSIVLPPSTAVIDRDALRRLPAEAEATEKRAGFDSDDLRLALRLDGTGTFSDPFLNNTFIEEAAYQMDIDASSPEYTTCTSSPTISKRDVVDEEEKVVRAGSSISTPVSTSLKSQFIAGRTRRGSTRLGNDVVSFNQSSNSNGFEEYINTINSTGRDDSLGNEANDWGWSGGSMNDRNQLMDVLSSILTN